MGTREAGDGGWRWSNKSTSCRWIDAVFLLFYLLPGISYWQSQEKGEKKSSISNFVLSLNVDFFLEFQTEIQVLELHEWIHYLNQYSFDLLFAMNHLASPYPAIPIDLFGSKKHRSLGHGELVFADSSGNIALRAKRQSSRPSSDSRHCKKMLLLDTAGIPLFSFYLDHVSPSSSLIPSTANDLFSRVLNWIAVKVLGKKIFWCKRKVFLNDTKYYKCIIPKYKQ